MKAKKVFINIVLLFVFFLISYSFLLPIKKVQAANPVTYYIDNAGSDSNNGTSDTTPWQTINKVNISTFNPGDQILFKRGGVWRETLTVPSSGNSSNRIVFGAYGDGNRPEINGSQLIANGSFTLDSIVPSVVYSSTPNTDSAAAGIRNYRMICPVTLSSNTVKIRLTASASADWNITAVSISEQSSIMSATTTPTQVLWDGGSISTKISTGASKDSDTLSYSVVAGHTYLVHIYMADKNYQGSSYESYYYDSNTASNESLLQTPNGGQLQNGPYNGGPVTAILGYNVNIYKVASATDPQAVWENGQFLSKQTSTLTGILGQWYWDGTYLYVCATDGGNIITGGKTYEKANLLYTINGNGKSWLEFKDINCSRAGKDGATVVGVRNDGNNNLWHDMEIYSDLGHAFSFMQGSVNCHVYNMKLHDSSSTTVVAIFGNNALNQTTGNYLEYSEIYQANPNCISSPIVLHGMSNGNFVQYNDIHLDVAYQTSLIFSYTAGTSNTIRYNYLHYTGGRILHAIYIEDNTVSGDAAGPYYIYGNIIDMRGQTGILAQEGIYFLNALGSSQVYNNTILMTNASYAAIGAVNTPNLTIEDNIIDAPYNLNIDANSQSGFVSDYNDFYYATGISLKWGANTYVTLANWLANSSQDAHSLNADPKFVDPASNYNLQATSPAIDAGYDTSTTTDYAANTRRDNFLVANTGGGTNPWYDLGAYEYIAPVAVTPAAPTVNIASSVSSIIIINSNGNADTTEYAIYNQTVAKYVQADGTLADAAIWQTRSVWGGDTGITNTGLTSNTSYVYQVKARNGDHVETALSGITSATTLATYVITASGSANGTVAPNGATTVNSGALQTYTITPASGYHIADVLVDNVSQGTITTYTFNNILAVHTISATFTADTVINHNVSTSSSSHSSNKSSKKKYIVINKVKYRVYTWTAKYKKILTTGLSKQQVVAVFQSLAAKSNLLMIHAKITGNKLITLQLAAPLKMSKAAFSKIMSTILSSLPYKTTPFISGKLR